MKRTARSADVNLRDVEDGDIPVFFAHQLDSEANRMAAFTRKDPADQAAHNAHWAKIRADRAVTIKTIVIGVEVAGYIAKFERDGAPEVTYWIGKDFWGRGVATEALARFLCTMTRRPIFARVAKDNAASLRILKKSGFKICGEERGFANARNREIDELVLELR